MTLQEPCSGPGAQSEALVFLSYFADLPDPRQAGKVIYPLQEILLLCLLAMLAGGGVLRRNRTVRRQEDRTSSKVPAVQGWDPVARPALRYFCDD